MKVKQLTNRFSKDTPILLRNNNNNNNDYLTRNRLPSSSSTTNSSSWSSSTTGSSKCNKSRYISLPIALLITMDLNILENPTLTAQYVANAVKENKNQICPNHPQTFGCSCHQMLPKSLEEDLAWILNDDDGNRQCLDSHSENSVF